MEVYCHPWTVLQVFTAQEDHGSGKYLVRVRYRLRPSGYLHGLGTLTILGGILAAGFQLWPLALVSGVLAAVGLGLWWRGTRRAGHFLTVFDRWAKNLGMIGLEPTVPQKRVMGE
jgi:hypothetical protein